MLLKSSSECNLLKTVRVTPKSPFWQTNNFLHFPKAVNRHNKALSLLCVTSSTLPLKRSQPSPSRPSAVGGVFPTHRAWGWQLQKPRADPSSPTHAQNKMQRTKNALWSPPSLLLLKTAAKERSPCQRKTKEALLAI